MHYDSELLLKKTFDSKEKQLISKRNKRETAIFKVKEQ